MKLIYFIDDDSDFRELVTRVIGVAGYECESFSDLQEALDRLQVTRVTPHQILLDYSVPGLKPKEFIDTVRRKPEWASIGLYVVSGMDELASLAKSAGADGFLVKPFDIRQMKRFLDKICAKA
jgi:CheY-like chemotaxis protein